MTQSKTIFFTVLATLCTGCLENASAPKKSTVQTTADTLSPASGPMAAKIIFKTGTNGSFDVPINGGTVPELGSGHKAVRIFAPNGTTTLATGDSSSASWGIPWLSFVEIGVSGSSNHNSSNSVKALSSDCAKFASTTESSASLCDYNKDGTADVPCGAPADYFRTSEFDCTPATTSAGAGGNDDPIYIRVKFDRTTSKLASHENVMAVLEYSASGIHPAPTSPTTCFSAGVFTPEQPGCSDMSWKVFLRNSDAVASAIKPFLMLVPPVFAYVDPANNRITSTAISTKQFLLPLSTDVSLDTFQISRTGATTTFIHNGNPNVICSNNSPLCVGMIFYSLSLYRL